MRKFNSTSLTRPVGLFGFYRIERLAVMAVRELVKEYLLNHGRESDYSDYLLSFLDDTRCVYNSARKDSKRYICK